jgi:hypothetical protein
MAPGNGRGCSSPDRTSIADKYKIYIKTKKSDMKILLIEDEASISRMICRGLEGAKYAVDVGA